LRTMCHMQHIYLISGLKKMKSISLLLILTYSTLLSSAQIPETNPDIYRTINWAVGDSLLINFDNSIKISSSSVHTSEAYASFSTSSGKLLYYSDGRNLYDSNNIVLSVVKGDKSSVQGVIITGNDSIISVTTTTDIGRNDGAHFYTFKNGIKTMDKKILSPVCEMQGRVKHSNQRNEWLVLHKFKSDSIYTFLNTEENLFCPSITRSSNYIGNKGSNAPGGLLFSPSGKKLALTIYSLNEFNADGIVTLFDFNNSTGQISYLTNTPILWLPLHSLFSPDESKLYVSERGKTLIQYDLKHLNQDSLKNSEKILWTANGTFSNMTLQHSLHNKVYGSIPDSLYLAEISSPNDTGFDANLDLNKISLNGKQLSYGLPNFNASYFYTPSIDFAYTEDCWEHTYSFEGRDTFDADGYKWVFEKGAYRDSILTKHCNYTFADTGKWQVSHIAWNASRADTVSKTLTIRPKWKNNLLGRDTFYCLPFDSGQGDSSARADFTLTLKAPADMHCVHWNGEEPNLDDALGLIVDYGHFHTDTLQVDTAGKYIVKLTNKTFCQMYDTITVSEVPNPQKPSIQRNGQELESSITAAEYRWYFNGNLTLTTINSQLIPDSNGYWQVQLISEYGCESQLSDSFNVGFASLKPLNPKPLSFKIYPNPSDGHISIEVPKEGQYNLTLSTIGGQLVRLSDSPQGELYRSVNKRIEFELNLANGTYILTLTDEDGKTGSKKIDAVR